MYCNVILTSCKTITTSLEFVIFNHYFFYLLNFICGLNVSIHFCTIYLIIADIPTVEPIDIPQYKYKNSKYERLPKLPARMRAVASSTGGKSVLVQTFVLKTYRDLFQRAHIFRVRHIHITNIYRLSSMWGVSYSGWGVFSDDSLLIRQAGCAWETMDLTDVP